MEARRRQLTRQSDDVAVSVGQSRSPVTISVIIIAFAAARETTAVIVADASRVVLTRGVGVLGVVLQFGKFGHENVVIDERNVLYNYVDYSYLFIYIHYQRARIGDWTAFL